MDSMLPGCTSTGGVQLKIKCISIYLKRIRSKHLEEYYLILQCQW